jgi:hypothetical protein
MLLSYNALWSVYELCSVRHFRRCTEDGERGSSILIDAAIQYRADNLWKLQLGSSMESNSNSEDHLHAFRVSVGVFVVHISAS